jgi:hypothetical protein
VGPVIGSPDLAAGRIAGGRRPVSVDAALLYVLAATLPFPLLGVALNELFTLSLSSVVGLVFAVIRVFRHGLRGLHWAALSMLLVFAATAAPRHEVPSYAFSLGALALALAPLTSPLSSPREIRVLLSGLLTGLQLTIVVVLLSIVVQVTGIEALAGGFAGLLVRPEMGNFLGYARPAAGFSEPSHLAIYLATAYVALDLLRRAGRYRGWLGPVVLMTVVFTGSLSGLMLIVAYLAARFAAGLGALVARGLSVRSLLRLLGGGALLAVAVVVASQNAADFMGDYATRLVQTQEDIESLNLVGSEASRVNAVLALPAYWDASGWPGFLVGTGYANHQAWLLSSYGDLSEWATFSRGQVDNLLVAVFLSTGALGFVAYLTFVGRAFSLRVLRAEVPVAVFVLAINFSYGYLISGLYWQLLFVLASVARYSVALRRNPVESAESKRVPRRGTEAAAA